MENDVQIKLFYTFYFHLFIFFFFRVICGWKKGGIDVLRKAFLSSYALYTFRATYMARFLFSTFKKKK